MSHVDEGELVAYADGAYPADHPAAQRIVQHLSECADCRTRLAQHETLRGHAAAILAYATPASVRAPAFETLQQEPHPVRRRRSIPLAWAATIVLAAGLGWFGRGMWQYQPRAADTVSMQAEGPAVPPSGLQTQTPGQMPQPAGRAMQQAQVRSGRGEPDPGAPPTSQRSARRQQRAELAEAAIEEVETQKGRASGSVATSDMAMSGAQTAASPAAPPPAPVAAHAERPLALRQVQLSHPVIPGLPVKSVITEGDTTIIEQTLPDGKMIQLTIMAATTEMREAAKSRAASDVARESTAGAAAAMPGHVTVTVGSRVIRLQGAVSSDSLRALARQIK